MIASANFNRLKVPQSRYFKKDDSHRHRVSTSPQTPPGVLRSHPALLLPNPINWLLLSLLEGQTEPQRGSFTSRKLSLLISGGTENCAWVFLSIKHSLRIPGWRSGVAPAFGPGRHPGDPGLNPMSGSRCMEPASPSACVSASLSLTVCLS